MKNMVVESVAKINLGLNVVRKRVDGFHDLETIFVPLMLSDIITFQKANKLRFESNSELLNDESNNLIIKAIRMLKEESKAKLLFNVNLEKNIPVGGGLGGGSSNAATTLKAINKQMELGISFQKLSELALTLGSDVPYFLNPVPSYAESRGEKLFPINLEIPYPMLLVNAGIKIETGWAFSKIKPSLPSIHLKDFISSGLPDFDVLRSNMKNDFEEIVFNEYPVLKKIKEELYKLGAQFALMSGTGSTIFGIFSNLQKAYWAEDYFKQNYFTFLNNPFYKSSIT
jgi:4-diphosphocytidyl-2-C-methyl-D-erythritol kinase